MLRVGLTGGFACGKSFVAEAFRARGARILDTDLIARELVAPGTPGLDAIVARFGPALLTPDRQLDRPALRARIFADPEAKAWLEDLLHPRIQALLDARSAALGAADPGAVVIQVIPLLFETRAERHLDRIAVVDCDPELQMQRALARGDWSADAVRAVIAAQCRRETRLAGADDVIDNNGDAGHTLAQVEALMARYRELAAGERS